MAETRILCVDDDPSILQIYERMLGRNGSGPSNGARERIELRQGPTGDRPAGGSQQAGYRVTLANSGEEAVDLVRASRASGEVRFSVGFFDMIMAGGMDGCQTIKQILEIDNEIGCAIVTGYSEYGFNQLRNLFPAPDQWLFLNKPFGTIELLQVAHNLASAWHLKRKAQEYALRLESEVRKRTLKYRQVADHLILINQFSKELATASDLGNLLNQILEELRLMIDATNGSLLLREADEHLLVIAATGPDRDKVIGLRNRIDENRISSHTLRTGNVLLIEDLDAAGSFSGAAESMRSDCATLISVPVMAQGRVVGVMNFGATKARAPFTQEECDVAATLGRQIGMALDNARLYKEIKSSYNELTRSYLLTVKALTKAIDAKDHYTYGHSRRVSGFTRAIAGCLGFSGAELEKLEWACTLHDVGKIGIGEAILNKPGRLTDEEFEIIRTHPEKGVEIIEDIPFLGNIRDIILHHHERFDGRGYPAGLCGEKIPVEARIIAVADTFDAMTSDRPYRHGLDRKAAFDEIVRCSGSQFDPWVVSGFTQAFAGFP